MTLPERIRLTGQKKILTLDGGGIRGMITVEILARIETILRERSGQPDLVLSDYFDFIAGTSTGAIIATCISLGLSVDAIRNFYVSSGAEMFDKAFLLRRFQYKFEDEKLAAKLQEVIGHDTVLGSDRLQTMLMLVMRNATTDSPWPVSNNPFAKYNSSSRPDNNLNLPLWQLVRASTAAPVYFPPEIVRIGTQEFVFVDGGITMYNNPSFQAFLMATVEPYKVCWPSGVGNILLVSVGTGANCIAKTDLDPVKMNLVYNATSLPSALMFSALNEQDFLCRCFGDCRAGDTIDREIGDMKGKAGPSTEKLFTYMRYNADLSRNGLDTLGLRDIEPDHVQKLDSIEFITQLQEVGRVVGERKVEPNQFDGF